MAPRRTIIEASKVYHSRRVEALAISGCLMHHELLHLCVAMVMQHAGKHMFVVIQPYTHDDKTDFASSKHGQVGIA